MKVLVSGSAGYLAGSLIPHLLEAGHDVVAIDNLFYGQKPINWHQIYGANRYEFWNVDIRDHYEISKWTNNCDATIWLAALVGAPICNKHPELAYETNFSATIKMVDGLSMEHRLIFPVTNSQYGSGGEKPLTEDSPTAPLSLYAETKCKAEGEVLCHYGATAFRLATCMGVSPRMRLDLLVNDLTYKAYFDRKIDLFEGHFRRNYVNLKDVSRIFIESLERKDMNQQVFNLGCDAANCTKLELLNKIKKFIDFEIVESNKIDIDKRDYIVSSERLSNKGLRAEIGLEDTIENLISLYDALPKEKEDRENMIKSWRNA